MALTLTEQEIRNQLGAFLTKPLIVETGVLSTQQTVSATSVGAGGIQGEWRLGPNGVIISNDGTNDRVKFGFLG